MHVAVLGSGLAGLTAAALLAKRGHRVSLYEQHPEIGGATSAIERDGFRWDLGRVLAHSSEGYCSMLNRSGTPHRTPCKGLWFLGSQSESGPGVWTQWMSSHNVCRALRKEA
jgi:phytoene dehydrogenase-like protein